MPRAKEHLNKPVISTSDGKILGKVKDVYFDPKLTKVTAVSLGSSGLLRRKTMLIDRSQVQLCGIDTWLVSSGDVVVSPENIFGAREFVAASELRGRDIVSEGGTSIATVDDIIIDGDCNVRGFSLGKAPPGPLADRKAIALSAITSPGSKTSPMTTMLAQAESTDIGTY
jgi:uncharacterized protein YrrD